MNLLLMIPLFGPEGGVNYPSSVGLRPGYLPVNSRAKEQEMALNQWMKLTPLGYVCFRATWLNYEQDQPLRGQAATPTAGDLVALSNQTISGNADRLRLKAEE